VTDGLDKAKKIELCMSVATFAATRFDKRRDFDWKMCLSIWGLLVGAILYVRAEAFPFWVGIAAMLLHFAWAKIVFVRNTSDQNICWTAVRKADAIFLEAHGSGILPPKDDRIERSSKGGIILDWSARIYLAITLTLVMLFYALCVEQTTWIRLAKITISKSS
jgi:hypothetical protein